MSETRSFLDKQGLKYFWDKIQEKIEEPIGVEELQLVCVTNEAEEPSSIELTNGIGESLGSVDISTFMGKGEDKVLDDVGIIEASDSLPIEYEGQIYTSGKFIKFTWNIATSSDGTPEKVKVDYLKVDEIGKTYSGSDSIDIGSDNSLSVKSVDAMKTVLKSDITIAGGPLANNVVENGDEWPWKDDAGNNIIPTGKSVHEVLTGLFLKVINGTVEWGNVSWSPSLARPTVALSEAGPVEVNTKVKVSTLTAGAATAGTRSAICACSQGHYLADAEGNPTGSHVPGNKTISVNASVSGDATLACTWNGVATDVTVNSTELIVVEGTNTIKASQSGQTASCVALPTTKVFAATNTKSVLPDVSASFSENKPADKPLTSENTDTINAYYPIYTNGKQGTANAQSNETTLVADDATKLNLVADNTIFYVLFAPMIDGGTGYRLLVKSGKTITQAMALNTLNGKYEVDMKDLFVKAVDSVKKLSGGVEIDYDVYEAKGSAGANALQIKID